MDLFFIADIIGIIAFSISGFLVALKNNLDLLGILIASFLTSIGGGIVRDILIDRTPFAFTHTYPSLTIVITLITVILVNLQTKEKLEDSKLFVLSDTIGLVAFSLAGALLGIEADFNFFGVLIVGFLTAIGGGVIRDVMINEVPAILISDFYGSIALLSGALLYLLNTFSTLNSITLGGVALFSITLRLLSYKYKWSLPKL